MRRTVSMAIGEFGLESLGGSSIRDPENLARSLIQAVRYYLADRDFRRAGWPYPSFRLDGEGESKIKVEMEIDAATWDALSKEAARQQVSPEQLIRHAVLYFAADRDGGRVAQRLAEGLLTSQA